MKFLLLFFLGFLLVPYPTLANEKCCVCDRVTNTWGNKPISSTYCRSITSDADCISRQIIPFTGGSTETTCSIKTKACNSLSECSPKNESSPQQSPQLITTDPDLKVPIPGLNLESVTCRSGEICSIGWIGQYVSALFNYGIAIAIALAVVIIMIGGLVWLMSGGRQEQIGRAKELIAGSFSGLVLALFAVILLQAINPNLVKFDPFNFRVSNKVIQASVGANEGVGAPASGGQTSLHPAGSNIAFNQIPGGNHLIGARPELTNLLNGLVPQLAQNGQLPVGIIITSGYRPGDTGSQHALGTAVDFWWPGIDLQSATSFRDAVHSVNPNIYILTEVRGHPDFQYFRGRGNGVVHIDMRNILGSR